LVVEAGGREVLGIGVIRMMSTAARTFVLLLTGARMLAVLVVTAVAFAFPAAASAAGTTEWLFTGKVKEHDGFKLSLRALPNSRHHPTTVDAVLHKGSGRGVGTVLQNSDYTFTSGLTLRGSRKLGSAHISGRFADKRGSIDLSFTATGPATKVPVQKGCVGTPGEKRKGMLRGSFVLKADRLGSVKLGSVHATLVRPPKITACFGPARGVQDSRDAGRQRHFLYTSPPHRGEANGVRVAAFKPRGTAPVAEEIDTFSRRPGFSVYHKYAVYAPRSDYTFSRDLSSATLDGYAGIKGTATYTGTSGVGSSNGTLNGNLSVNMAAIGTVEPFASGPLRAFQQAN
jgi:hypothetical protein